MKSQTIAVKSNLLYDLTSSINAGIELGLSPHWTLDISGNYNGWTMSHDRRWKHWAVQPEVRYWLCDRFGAHFFGAHLHGGQYNIGGFDGRVKFLGTDARMVYRWGRGIRLCMAPRSPLELGDGNRFRLFLYPL